MATIYDIQGTMFWAYASGQSNWGPYIELTSVWDDGNLIRYNWEIGIWYKYNWSFNFTWEYRWGESGAGTGTGSSGSLSVDDGRTDGVERYVYTTGSDYWTRTNNDRSVYLQGYVSSSLGSGTADTGWFTIPKLNAAKTYTISFDANGGSGAPSAQTKTENVNLTLSSTVPTRANYTFKGWSISPTSKVGVFAAGSTFTYNAGITLYAVWEYSGTAPTLYLAASKFLNKTGLSTFWNGVKAKFGPTILYDRGSRTPLSNTSAPSDRSVTLTESCLNYSKIVIEFVFENNFYVTTTIYNPRPNYKFNIIHTRFCDNGRSGAFDYDTICGRCRISGNGTVLRCEYYDGVWAAPSDMGQWIPTPYDVRHTINKVIGYKI